MANKIPLRQAVKLFAFFMLIATASSVSAEIIYVDEDAPGANNGSSWTDAYRYLQDALPVATYADEIRVAQGRYKPDQGANQTAGDRRATFQLKNGVAIKGGYAGFGQPEPDTRDIEKYKTVLSGDLSGNDVEVNNPLDLLTDPTRADNSYDVVTGSRTDARAVLDGFVVTGGNAVEWTGGGGMYNFSGSPTITNCTFAANSALADGGGVHSRALSNPTFTDCVFKANGAFAHGGGMYNGESSNPTLTRCEFTANGVVGDGGGLYNMHGSRATLANCTFRRNSAGGPGGGMGGFAEGDSALTECVFSENSAGWKGGGIDTSASPVLVKCTFIHNSAGWGGGMSTANGNPTLINCVFTANHAEGAGGLAIDSGAPALANCVFIGNSADRYGGAVSSAQWHPPDNTATFINCTFNGNLAGEGGGLVVRGFYGRLKLTNCILWGNLPDAIVQWTGDRVLTTYSNVQGGWPGEGNIGTDPLFADPDGPDGIAGTSDDNLRLLPGSPCIDPGDNTAVPAGITTDLDGNPRFSNDPGTPDTGSGTPPIVDMGAYEFVYTGPEPVDDLVSISVGRASYDRRTAQFSVNATITNTSQVVIYNPVWLVIETISNPGVTLSNADGTTIDGKPYVDLSGLLGNGQLDPGETISKRIYFNNPNRVQFTFEPSLRGMILP